MPLNRKFRTGTSPLRIIRCRHVGRQVLLLYERYAPVGRRRAAGLSEILLSQKAFLMILAKRAYETREDDMKKAEMGE